MHHQRLTQIVKGPIHIKGNIMDLIMSDKPSLCSLVSTECQIGISDHYLLTTTLLVSPEMEQVPPLPVWLCQKADCDGLRYELGGTNWKNIIKTKYPERYYIHFTKPIKTAMEKRIPRRMIRSFPGKTKWYNDACVIAFNRK